MRDELRKLLYLAIQELSYCHEAEVLEQVTSSKGKWIVDEGMKLLGVKDLSAESLLSAPEAAPQPAGEDWLDAFGAIALYLPDRHEEALKLVAFIRTAAEREMARAREALEFAKGAIEDAISLEDGLDGAAGQAVLKMIDRTLSTSAGEGR